jgi:hypothetical protein
MASIRDRAMSRKREAPKVSINFVKRKATGNYEPTSPLPFKKIPRSKSLSGFNAEVKEGDLRKISQHQFTQTTSIN